MAKESVGELSTRLQQLTDQKRHLLQEKQALKQQISELLSKVKDLKQERDSLTAQVKEQKKERDALNEQIKVRASAVKGLEKVQRPKENPLRTKKRMEELELKLETEVVSFSKEQGMMKKIKELKKAYDEAVQTHDNFVKMKELRTLKSKANKIHKKIQESASQSQGKHVGMLDILKQVDELRKKEKNIPLTDKTKEIKEVRKNLDGIQGVKKLKKETAKQSKLEEKRKEVEEKFSKGKKLTTEDFLVMQDDSTH